MKQEPTSNTGKKSKGIFEPSIMEHRERVAKAIPMSKSAPNVAFIDSLIPLSDNVKIPVRIYTPLNQKHPLPTLFYVPGTAFIAHEIEFTRVVCSHICQLVQCQVVVINHRLAPENQFPTGYKDAYEVLQFFLKKMPECHNIDQERVVIAGYSSGGNFAALMTVQAQKDNLHISRQILISPIVDLSRSLKKFKAFEEKDSDISDEFVNWFLNLYLPQDANPKNPDLSPFWQSKKDIKNLPPTDIIFGEIDRFRSDAELYFEKLKNANLDVNRIVLDKQTHAYLWHKLEVVEIISERLRRTFFPDTISHLPYPRHSVLFIKPTLGKKNKEKELPLRAKL